MKNMNQIRIGLIGAGNIANWHLPGIEAAEGGTLTALCDIDENRLNLAGDQYGIPENRRFTNYQELISCDDVDAVDICTPNYLHAEMAIFAAEKGKAICVEKPLCMNYKEALSVQKAVQKAGTPFMICFSYRFIPAVRFARWILEKGELGDVVNIYVQYLKSSAFMDGRRLEWRFEKNKAGSGVLGDLGSHLIDMTRFLVGEVKGVFSQTGIVVKKRPRLNSDSLADVETDDYCHFLAKLDCGASGTFSVSRCAIGNANSIRFEVYGTKGALAFDLNNHDTLGVCIGDIDRITEGMHTIRVPKKYKISQMQTFIDIVQGRGDELSPVLDDAVKCQRILAALLDSHERKRWIDISNDVI